MDFELLNNLIKEYVFIVDVLKENVSEEIINKENKIYLNRETFEKLLSKNMFISLEKKNFFGVIMAGFLVIKIHLDLQK